MSNYNFNNKVNTTNTQASENEQKNIQDKSGIDYLNNYPSNNNVDSKRKIIKTLVIFGGAVILLAGILTLILLLVNKN